jgi:hypothetical protein
MCQVATQQTDVKDKKVTPCYVSYLTFVNMLDHLKGLKVMPTRIDNSLWSGKFSGSNGVLLNAGLKFLKLVDGDKPNEAFESLVFAEADGRKALLKETLGKAYGSELTNLANKTPRMVDEAIRGLGSTDSTHRKAISFFIQAAKAADITMPSVIAKRARNRPGTPARRRTNGASPSEKPRAASDEHKQPILNGEDGAAKIVELHGATVKLWSSSANLIQLAAFPDELKWFTEVLAKFTEGESLANRKPTE